MAITGLRRTRGTMYSPLCFGRSLHKNILKLKSFVAELNWLMHSHNPVTTCKQHMVFRVTAAAADFLERLALELDVPPSRYEERKVVITRSATGLVAKSRV